MANNQKESDSFRLKSGDNITLYTTCGSREGPGFRQCRGLDKEMWEKQIEFFKSNYQVIADEWNKSYISGRATDFKTLIYSNSSKPVFSFKYSKMNEDVKNAKCLAKNLDAD
ncbi:hypothetical protein [Mangrovivirga cuniculi]|uniref:Uncharacterized protein n=1 Tax=Mangrovivirga cuniculi TaxID=2715131 RepID=A0A4D7JKJ6_9BACT|nr:hypothetical protein [Mangrovivirga cuniculi]QCK16121.1 hypothetical protein DCC35_15920 [Mangrovivirga cuniculi]